MPKINWIGLFVILGGVLLAGFVFLGKESEIELSVGEYRSEATPTPLPKTIPEERNLSEQFAKTISQELIDQNPTGPQEIAGQPSLVLDPKTVVDEMFKTSFETSAAEMPVISIKDFQVVPQSTDSERMYLAAVRGIINQSFGGFPQEDIAKMYYDALASNDYSKLADFSRKLERAFQNLRNLAVPQSWVADHKKSLELLGQARLITNALLAWQEDPMRALIAVNLYPKFLGDSRSLLNTYARHIESVGL